MKKFAILIAMTFFCLSLSIQSFGNTETNFIENFAHCRNHIENGNTKISIIYGFANRDCHYEEITYNKSLRCAFSVMQLIEISKEMTEKNFNPADGIESLSSVKEIRYNVCKIKFN